MSDKLHQCVVPNDAGMSNMIWVCPVCGQQWTFDTLYNCWYIADDNTGIAIYRPFPSGQETGT